MFILKTGHQPGVYVPLRALFLVILKYRPIVGYLLLVFEPRYEKTGFLHMRKQRRRSASR